MASPPITLSDLTTGASAVIQDMSTGHDEHITRLRELGMVPGTRVRLVRRAPLGDPIEVSVRGSRLAVRRSEAFHIKIIPDLPALAGVPADEVQVVGAGS